MALVAWKNENNTWDTILDGEKSLKKLSLFYEIADVIVSNVVIECIITELLQDYSKSYKDIDLDMSKIGEMSYKEKSEQLHMILSSLGSNPINRKLINFVEDMSLANKFRDRMAHRNIYNFISKNETYRRMVRRDKDLVKTNLKVDLGVNELDKKADAHQIFMSFDKLVMKHIQLILLLLQGMSKEIVDATLNDVLNDDLLFVIGVKEQNV